MRHDDACAVAVAVRAADVCADMTQEHLAASCILAGGVAQPLQVGTTSHACLLHARVEGTASAVLTIAHSAPQVCECQICAHGVRACSNG
jgi:hypothetical protein